jgi:hypothetical protein
LILKLRTLAGLALYILALLVAITVLYKYANESSLHQALFTYHVQIKNIGNFVPFSIVSTVFGVILGLWWNGLDKALRTLQPYVSMTKSSRNMRRGVSISYQSSYWLWASVKAARNKHWLLSVATLGTFVAQACE